MVTIWIVLLIAFLVVELITAGLTTIWFAGGSLVSMILAALEVPLPIQIIVFFIVSFILLFLTRPLAVKYVKTDKLKTNYESAIGKKVFIKERVDNRKGTGIADLSGQEWTARMMDETLTLEAGEHGIVAEVSGVKLMLKPIVEAKQV